jgi:hypothetical protein
VVASLLVVGLSVRASDPRWSPLLAKWVLIAAAILSAVPLVVSVSGR